jgi:tetratricopeptide (TPR) repeat protein
MRPLADLELLAQARASRTEPTTRELEQASALEHAGSWEAAAAVYRRLFRRSVAAREVSGVVQALYGQARTFRELRRWDEAEELTELCRHIAAATGAAAMAARALNLYGVLRFSRGDLDGARSLYEDAVERARETGDRRLLGYACQNLGVVANIRGDLGEARLLYLEAVGASMQAGDHRSTATAYNKLGMVCTELAEYLEAEMYFDRGVELAERIGDVAILARLHANRAEPMIRVGDHDRARRTLACAEALAVEIHAASTLSTVARHRGLMNEAEGARAEARRQLESSLAIADGAGLLLARAEALDALARLSAAEGRVEEAAERRQAAYDVYRSLGAARDAERLEPLID